MPLLFIFITFVFFKPIFIKFDFFSDVRQQNTYLIKNYIKW